MVTAEGDQGDPRRQIPGGSAVGDSGQRVDRLDSANDLRQIARKVAGRLVADAFSEMREGVEKSSVPTSRETDLRRQFEDFEVGHEVQLGQLDARRIGESAGRLEQPPHVAVTNKMKPLFWEVPLRIPQSPVLTPVVLARRWNKSFRLEVPISRDVCVTRRFFGWSCF